MKKRLSEKKPYWLKTSLPSGKNYFFIKRVISYYKVNTVCEESLCPNISRCWHEKTCTFLILGNICTRRCKFCGVESGIPLPPDQDEPDTIANVVRILGLNYCVITSVTRDDLDDGGSGIYARTIQIIKELSPSTKVELLIPDFKGEMDPLRKICQPNPHVIGHNLEVVPRIQRLIRDKASYEVSMYVLEQIKRLNPSIRTKTGLQVGHGETLDELRQVFNDLVKVKIDILTIGQYLQPTFSHINVKKFYTPKEFEMLRDMAVDAGIPRVISGALVRSSFMAEQIYLTS